MSDLNVAGRIREFDGRNGGNPVQWGIWFWYANGATREFDPMGALIDPPADEYARLTNVLRYHQARLAKAVEAFDNFKQRLSMSPSPDPQGLHQLKQLQAVVADRKEDVEEATRALAATDEGQRREQNRRDDAERREKQAAFKNDLREIRV